MIWRKGIIIVLFVFIVGENYAQNDAKYYKNIAVNAKDKRLAAEWESAEYLVLAWKNYPEVLGKIAHYAQDEGKVLIICKDSMEVLQFLQLKNYRTDHIQFLQIAFNSPWIRDYSPANLYKNGTTSVDFVDWIYNRKRIEDDQIPLQLSVFLKKRLLQINLENKGINQVGGNLMNDGFTTAFSTRLVLKDNKEASEGKIKKVVQKHLGVKNYILTDTLPYDFIHHIDMHMKLINPYTLLVGKFPEGISDEPYIKNNVNEILKNYKTCFGNDFKIVEIPMPDDFGRYPDSSGWADYLTYTNSLIFNKTVFVPLYNNQSDQMALDIYQNNFPGYRIIGIDTEEPIVDGGAIHCLSYTIPKDTAFYIWHEAKKRISANTEIINILASVYFPKKIEKLAVFYKYNLNDEYKKQVMTRQKPDNFFSQKVVFPKDKNHFYYYLKASYHEKSSFLPISAPKGYFLSSRNIEKDSRLLYRFTKDTILFRKNKIKLNNYVRYSMNKNCSYYWKSLDDLKIKNATNEKAQTRIPMKNRQKIYSFLITLSDGEKIVSDTLNIQTN